MLKAVLIGRLDDWPNEGTAGFTNALAQFQSTGQGTGNTNRPSP